MPIQRVLALSGVRIPHFEGAIGGPGHHREPVHLARPDAAGVADQGPEAAPGGGGPHLEGVVVGAADDPVLAKLEACDDMVVVAV